MTKVVPSPQTAEQTADLPKPPADPFRDRTERMLVALHQWSRIKPQPDDPALYVDDVDEAASTGC